jgi:hypothetical protein
MQMYIIICRVNRRALCHSIALGFLFQNVTITATEKRTLNSKNTFKNVAFRVPFEIVKF